MREKFRVMRGRVLKECSGRWCGVWICEWSFLPNGAALFSLSLSLSHIDVYLTWCSILILDSHWSHSQGSMHLGKASLSNLSAWKPPSAELRLSYWLGSSTQPTRLQLTLVHIWAPPSLSVAFGFSHLTSLILHFSPVKWE